MAEKFGVLFENIQYNLNGAFIKNIEFNILAK
jgi:hypothetical protein